MIGQRIEEADNTRSMLICAELKKRGHEVIMWTSAFDHIRKEWRKEYLENKDHFIHPKFGFKIKFFKGCGYKRNMSFMRFFDHWLGARDFVKQAKNSKLPNVILASIPDHFTAAIASDFGKKNNIPVIIDVRDKWPDIFPGMVKNNFLSLLISISIFFERKRIYKGIKKSYAVVAMMDSLLDWGLKAAQRDKSKLDSLFYLTPFDNNFDTGLKIHGELNENVSSVLKRLEGKIVFTYIGTFNRSQHPTLLLQAIEILVNTYRIDMSKIEFIIGGHGLDAETVEAESSKFANVTYLGWLNTNNMMAVLSKSDVGLLLLRYPFPALNNKCFAYMSNGLAMINSADGPIFELINEYQFGININAGSPGEIAKAIKSICDSPEKLAQMRENSKYVFKKLFDKSENYRNYANHIELVVSEFQKRLN